MVRIGELFSDASVFVMPPFQRPYSWDEDTAAQLYDDISSAMVRGRPDRPGRKNRQEYFLGPIIVTRSPTSGAFEVVDGQQRLVTLAILLAVLRDSLPRDDAFRDELQQLLIRPERRARRLDERPRVQLRDADQGRFFKWVQSPGGTKDLPNEQELEEESDACVRLRDAIARIAEDIDNPQEIYIKQLATFTLTNCYVIQITARDLDDGYVLFRSLNSRGQPLDELDLARAELLGSQSPDQHIDTKKLAEDWTLAENSLGPDEFKDYLFSVLSLIAIRPQGRDLRDLMKEVLADPLKARQFRILLGTVLRHSAKLRDGVMEFGPDSERINRFVQCLRHSPIPEWRSVALPWLATNPSAYDTLRFFQALDALCLGLQILGKNKTQRLRRLKAAAAEVLTERERALNRAGALRFTDAEQTQIKSVLANPIGAKKGFLKALLLRLNAEMLDATIPVYFPEAVTIEHVLPQRPAANGPWPAKYPNAARRKVCTELLGNYALLTRPINARAKNLDFAEKRRVIFAAINNQAFPITIDLTNYESWAEIELVERQQKLVGLALGMLGFAPAIAWPAAAE
jgi:hypothetical protein